MLNQTYANDRASVVLPILQDDESDSAIVIETEKNVLPLTQFLTDFSQSLFGAVSVQNPPIYTGEADEGRAAVMAAFKRQPFPAQQRIAQAIARLLIDQDERAAVINADMGTGKTMQGIAVASLLHAEGFARSLILSPPHLVYKWRREILETVPNATVWVLNGPDTLMKLIQLRATLQAGKSAPKGPEFFILGRVRLRMGFHWRPAFAIRKIRGVIRKEAEDGCEIVKTSSRDYAACSHCGDYFKDTLGENLKAYQFPQDKRRNCDTCGKPAWTLTRASAVSSPRAALLKNLCALPTIGRKTAEKLIDQLGESFLTQMLGDNIHQFINLMDANGQFVFSESQAARMERGLAKLELSVGQGHYQASEYIKRYLPKGFFSLLIVDEAHEFKSQDSAQGQAMGVLASQVKKILLLTGTLMGGYADDLFHLLWRVMPRRFIEDGFVYQHGSLGGAAMGFMDLHGILKRTFRGQEGDHHRTARGRRDKVRISKAPGFGPKGIARYVLPYTAFLKLDEIGQAVLPTYQEHFTEVSLPIAQADIYQALQHDLSSELRSALRKGDTALLGVVLNCLLGWPDTCFKEEIVKHPRTGRVLAKLPILLDEQPSPKEAQLIELCQLAQSRGERTLVYTTYTGVRDTTGRLKGQLEQADFKVAILKASVNTDAREDWIQDQVDAGIDVLICNPELVKTGLDLLAFPRIVFMQSGFNLYTLMQASRRSWRIGQTKAVNVHFLGYRDTTQIACLSLMAKKIAVAQSTSGTMPDTGLDVLSQDGDSIEVALAKQLLH